MAEHKVKFPYYVRTQSDDIDPKIDWCFKNFGPCRKRWDHSTSWTVTRFFFQTEKDMVWFKLRWS